MDAISINISTRVSIVISAHVLLVVNLSYRYSTERADGQMERLSGLLVFYETLFADGFQLILQIYIILSDSERRVDGRQVLSMLSSLVTVSKASIGLLLIQTNKSNPRSIEEFLNPENLNDDSLLDGKSIPQKLMSIN